ncbi:unnamed protein product, partial [Closterium sp. NIES-54]
MQIQTARRIPSCSGSSSNSEISTSLSPIGRIGNTVLPGIWREFTSNQRQGGRLRRKAIRQSCSAEGVPRFAGGSTVTSAVTSGGESAEMASGGRNEEAENVDGGAGGVGMEMSGVLFRWGEMGVKVAFRSYDFPRHVIILGGLTDGLLPTQYTARLASELAAAHWSLLQTQLSSSYFGYGASSLEQDAAEIDELIAYIIRRYHASEVVLVGHSTGCQVNTTENMVCQVNTTEELRQVNITEEHEVPGEYNRGVACPVNTTEDLTFQVNTTEGLRF